MVDLLDAREAIACADWDSSSAGWGQLFIQLLA
jgi:hypothetical protein